MGFSRRRLGNAVLLGMLILIAFSSIYMFFQLQFPGDDEFRLQREEIFQLEQRLKMLEDSIVRSRQVIAQMQHSVANMSRGTVGGVLVSLAVNKAAGVSVAPSAFDRLFTAKAGQQFQPMQAVTSFAPMSTLVADFSEDDADQCKTILHPTNASDISILNTYRVLPFDDKDGGVWKQGFNIVPTPKRFSRDRPLQIFIVPHSHNDPGWIKTIDEYYKTSTKHILSLTMLHLARNKDMSFIWAEISYLSMWWNEASPKPRELFQSLVESGQLELVTGGWVMTDEATTHYYAMIDQMIEGHEWIRVNMKGLAVKPQSGWAIDPFGLSPTMAFILKRMGLKQMVIQRAHYAVKKELARQKQLEFFWRQQFDYGIDTDILCHMMPFYSYDVPHTCGPEPAVCCQFDFRRLQALVEKPRISCPWGKAPHLITNDNVHERATMLIDQYKKKAELFQSDVLLIPLGDDFRWSSEAEWVAQYSNYGALMSYINEHSEEFGAAMQWGTLNDYFSTLTANLESKKKKFPSLSGDFFTYADRTDHYWSGYYASRPFYKRLARVVESRLRAAELMFSWLMTRTHEGGNDDVPGANNSSAYALLNSLFTELVLARRNLGVFQHHDAIVGTARTAVMNDYGIRLINSLRSCDRIISTSLAITLLTTYYNELLQKPQQSTSVLDMAQFSISHLHSKNLPISTLISSDEILTRHDSMPMKESLLLSVAQQEQKKPNFAPLNYTGALIRRRIVVYNSLATERIELVRMRVSWPYVKLLTFNDSTAALHAIQCQISPVFEPETNDEAVTSEYELAFLARVPPYGARTYDVVGVDMLEATRQINTGHESNATICTFPRITFIKKPPTNGNAFYAEVLNGPFRIENLSAIDVLALPAAVSAHMLTLETSFISVRLSASSGTLLDVTVKRKRNGGTSKHDGEKTHKLNVNFVTYTARTGAERSGAYLFLPDPKPNEFLPGFEMLRLVKGALYSEALVVKQQQHVHQFMRVYNSPGIDGQSVEIENHVDINDAALNNRELVMLIDTDIDNTEVTNQTLDQFVPQDKRRPVMYTDLNGFQMIKRITMLEKLPLQANFYPMPSTVYIQDKKSRLTVLGAQPLGVASLATGQLQIMLDRRLAQDDNRGLGQSVQDNKAETSSRFMLTFEPTAPHQDSASVEPEKHPYLSMTCQHVMLSLLHPIMVYFFRNTQNFAQKPLEGDAAGAARLLDSYLSQNSSRASLVFSAMSAPLPCDMHLLNIRTEIAVESSGKTFEPAPHALVLLHRFGADCSMMPAYGFNCPASAGRNGRVNMAEVFSEFSHRNWTFIEHKNLSPLHAGSAVSAAEPVRVNVMDIACFRVPLGVVVGA